MTLAPNGAPASAPSSNLSGAIPRIPLHGVGNSLTEHVFIVPPHGRATTTLDANLAPYDSSGGILHSHELVELDLGMMLTVAGEWVNSRLETGANDHNIDECAEEDGMLG